jgi:RNA polymerase sigma factor FliA
MLHPIWQKKLETPMINDALQAYASSNIDAPEALIKKHSELVRRIAWHVYNRMSSAIEVEDLIQIGILALVEAAQGFDSRGIPFRPYAATRIRGSMIDALRRDARIGRAAMVNKRQLATIRGRLTQEYMRNPTEAEMIEAMGLEASAYFAMVASTTNIELEAIEDKYSDHDMWFADLSDGADTVLEQEQLRETLVACLTKLSEREALILQLYFVEELNLDEIGETVGVGAARVSQIKKAALDKLRIMLGK